MKSETLTLKTLIYICSLSIVTLLVLWFLQIALLDYSYEQHQLTTIKKAVKKIEESDLTQINLGDIADQYGVCIEHYIGYEKISYNLKNQGCILNSKNHTVIKYKQQLIDDSDLNYLEIYIEDSNVKHILYEVRPSNGDIIFLNSTLDDIGIVSKQLRSQLLYIIIILIVVSVIVAVFISRNINKPILKIIESAKELGKGNYNVKFEKSDIKELDDLADVLTVAASEMNKTDELRRDLIANVSHDLKTPLTMIKAYAEKVRDLSYKDKKKMEQDLNVIIDETDRLNILVNDILDLSKLDAKVEELNIQEYDLVENLNDILKRYDITIEKEGYKFEIDIPDKAIIKADKVKMEQVIYNLINNAIDHTGEDLKIKIKITKNKAGVEFSVTDTGKGIPEEERALVWNKYYKKEKKHKRNVIGSGIGLSIVKKILDAHGFKYGIDSKVNKYTTFYVKFHK